MVPVQPISAKLGEIRFRTKITHQHFGEREIFPQEYSNKEMSRILKERTKRVISDFGELSKRRITFSPFLEIGCEYGQAALTLVNKFESKGFATDLVKEPLSLLPRIAKTLGFNRLPRILICDAESLPFPNNSFPFVFCYQTLHHFPHPGRVVREVYRVLAPGGWFFFGDEPVAQTLNIPLWRRPTKLRWWEKILKATLLLPFISKIGKTEVDHGIIEEVFPISVWKQALEPFAQVEAKLLPYPLGPKGSLEKKNGLWYGLTFWGWLNRLLLFFTGGGIKGVARKKGKSLAKISEFIPLACVNCWSKKDHPKLLRKHQTLFCSNCGHVYPKRDSIFMLLPKKLEKRLYPSN